MGSCWKPAEFLRISRIETRPHRFITFVFLLRAAAVAAAVAVASTTFSDGVAGAGERAATGGPALPKSAKPSVPAGRDPGGIAVALIDTGVNYTLPEIASRLARDGEGQIIGYDFQDEDARPFDAKPRKKPSLNGSRPGTPEPRGAQNARRRPLRHGTTVASILLQEAKGLRLIPLRYKAGDPTAFSRIVHFISQTPARIVSMSLGGAKRDDWQPFAKAARHFKDLLFIVSAGNDGMDIDLAPIYPAAFRLPNFIVVASSDASGRYPRESNWGRRSVDISTPGEQLQALDFEGARVRVSGSSFAVPRIAALAARILAGEPRLTVTGLKQRILSLAVDNPGERQPRSHYGWIPNPTRSYRSP